MLLTVFGLADCCIKALVAARGEPLEEAAPSAASAASALEAAPLLLVRLSNAKVHVNALPNFWHGLRTSLTALNRARRLITLSTVIPVKVEQEFLSTT